MEAIFKVITSKVISEFNRFPRVIGLLISRPKELFSSIDNHQSTFLKALSFSAVISFLITLLSIPSFKTNHVEVESLLLTLDVFINIILLVIYSLITYISARIFFGRGGVLRTISAFLYVSPLLVLIKLLEIPTRIVRDKELLAGALTPSTVENMTLAINSNPYLLVSELLVGVGYIWFVCVLFLLLKTVHNFGFMRALLSSGLTMWLISLGVYWIQRPVIHVLLNAFSLNK
ncbi:YIP1 family protein [uncultured Shewanella sp.]|uniref:YIP1 family protein n=1 Tax=uncultured Shewanella sp. TaxID=173975 RepID=UPI00262170D1|nr:YIP1 family protein [uncultured Shewanella sp.]